MNNIELAWRNYTAAERRVDACRKANDLTGLAIAQTSAAFWFAEWKAADVRAANRSSTASPAA